ncbi:hypothetical protein OHV05_00165 [Kitasatospora sp. NBC_00070]|uniref:hypothetical protein n=1 Tax=Kitasatospora sp. NBC_00070 TaxID=2975962 RepID=UPI003255D051
MADAGSAEVTLDGGWEGFASWRPQARAELGTSARTDGVQVRVVDRGVYVGGNTEYSAYLGGRHWKRLDPADPVVGREAGLGLAPVVAFGRRLDPTRGLEKSSLEAVAKVGRERLGEENTTHYRAVMRADYYFEDTSPGQATVDYWVNDRDQLIQQAHAPDPAAQGGTTTIRYARLGVPVDVTVPARADVLDPLLGRPEH